MAVGRISGPLLKRNLIRDGVELTVRNTASDADILYIDVVNGRIGVNSSTPGYDLDVNGIINTTSLRSGYANIDNVEINDSYIKSTVGDLTIEAATAFDKVVIQQKAQISNIVGDVQLDGSLHATGNITADGGIVFGGDVNSNIIPDLDATYDLGSITQNWQKIHVQTLDSNTDVITVDVLGALRLPIGTTLERPTPTKGMIRFNTDDSRFEAYDGVAWTGVGGVIDVDQNTYIVAETSPGANNNDLDFYTDGVHRLQIDPLGVFRFGDNLDKFVIDWFEGNTAISGNLDVTGQATLASANIEDLTNGRVVLAGTNGELEDSSNLTFDGTTLTVTGNVDVSGNVTIGGNITIGDATTDSITIAAEFESHLIPSEDSLYDLGSETKKWRSLYISGDTLFLGGLQLKDDGEGNLQIELSDGSEARTNLKANVIDAFSIGTDDIRIDGNVIETINSNSDLELRASGAGVISIPTNNLEVANNVTISGNVDIAGDLTLGGNIIIGNATTDSITVAADFEGNLVPNASNTYDLGSNTKRWRNLFVGSADFENLTADIMSANEYFGGPINTDDIRIAGNRISTTASNANLELIVSGTGEIDLLDNTNVTGVLDVSDSLTVTYSITSETLDVNTSATIATLQVEDLTSGRVVLAGTSGEIEDNANLTFDGTLLTVTGNTTVTGTLDVDTDATIATLQVEDLTSGRVVLAGTSGEIEDSANLTFDGTLLTVTGNTSITGTLDVDTSATFASANVEDLTDNRIVIAGTNGELEDDSNFIFDGTTFKVGTDTTDKFTVDVATGNTNIAGTINIDGQVTLASANVEDLTSGRIVLAGTNGELEDNANLTFDGSTLDVTGDVSASGDVASATVTVSGNATVGGNTTVGGTLAVTGTSLFNDTVDMNSNTIANLADPVADTDAANKRYVDTIAAAGIHYHDPVRVESPVELNALYDNGTSGVGATLTNNGAQAAISIDGVALNLNDRVLVYEQTNAAHNGIYVVTTVGDGTTSWVLTRATDSDSYAPSDPDSLGQGDGFFVKEGDTGAGELYVMTTEGAITFGTTAITFSQVAETAVYDAGAGISLAGTTFSVNVDDSTIEISANALQLKSSVAGAGLIYTDGILDVVGTADRITVGANSIDIASTYVGQSSITTLGTITTGVWNGTSIADANIDDDLTITGGVINATPIGQTNAAAGSFTNITTSGTAAFTGSLSVNTNKFTVAGTTGNTAIAGTLDVTGNTTLSSDTNIGGNLAVAGNSTIAGTLGVTGESTLASAKISDLTSGRVVLAGVDGAIEDSANLTFDGTTLSVIGDIDITGDLTLGGNITIGDADTDSITVAADFESNLVPNISNTYDLGTSSQRWRNLYVGTANFTGVGVDTLTANTITTTTITANEYFGGPINTDDIRIAGNRISTTSSNADLEIVVNGTGNVEILNSTNITGALGVSTDLTANTGDITTSLAVGTTLDVNGQSTLASVNVEDLTSGRVVLAGTSGEIEDSANLTFDGTTLTVTGSLSTTVEATLASAKVSDLTDNRIVIAGASGALEDDANFTFDGTSFNISNTFAVTVASGNVSTTGSLEVGTTANVDGNFSVNTTQFTVDSTNGNTYAAGTLTVDSAVDFNSDLTVDGNIVLGSAATNTLTINADVSSSLIPSVTSTYDLGDVSARWNTVYANDINLTGTVTSAGSQSIQGDLNVALQATLASANVADLTEDRIVIVGINGELEDSINLVFDGIELNVGQGNFTVQVGTGDVDIAGDLSIQGDLAVYGTVTTINSTTVTIDDPVFTLGGDTAPTIDDNKDRGIEFRWHDGTNAKVGFFGYDDSAEAFTFIPDATNTAEVFSGAVGNVIFADGDFTNIDVSAQATLASANIEDLTSGRVVLAGTSGAIEDSANLTFDVDVNSQSTLASANIEDLTSGRVVLAGTNGELEDNADLVFTGTEFDIGQGNFTVNVSNGNVSAAGNLILGGDLTVNGTTTIVNSTTETIDDPVFTLGGDTAPTGDDNKDRGIEFRWHDGTNAKVGFFGYDDSIGKFTFIPDATNTSEVFSGAVGDALFNDLELGSATINAIQIGISAANEIDTTAGNLVLDSTGGTVSVDDNLIVSGETTLASAIVSDLTDTRIVIAGASGALEDSSNLTFDGNSLSIGVGNFTVAHASGNVYTTGTLETDGEATLASAIIEDLTTGRIVLAGTGGAIEDSANLTFDGTLLTVTGNTIITGTLDVNSQGTIASVNIEDLTDNRIVIAGTNGELEDDGNFTFDGTTFNIGATGEFIVDVATGNTQIVGTLGVTGDITGDVIGNVTGNVTGNVSGTSSSWATARTVTFAGGDVTGSFDIDGSTDINNVALTLSANSVILGTDTTGNYIASINGSPDISVVVVGDETATVTLDLTDTGVLARSYGSTTEIPVITVDAKGRITTVTTQTITTSFGISDGTNNDDVANGETITFTGGTGINTSVTNNEIIIDLADTGVTANTYGTATAIPSFTVDSQGRITNVTTNLLVETLDISDGSSTTTIDLLTETLSVAGTSNETTVSVSENTITVGLADDIDITGTLTVAGNTTLSANLTVTGDLTIQGTTTTVNSTVTTTEDPVLRVGISGLNASDGKDRGIEFLHWDSSAKTGFFGFDEGTSRFTFIPDATNSGEVFTGTADARTRAAISVTDEGGDGSLSYNSTTGVITYTGPGAAEVRAHFSAGGDLSYDSATGVFSVTTYKDADARAAISASGDLSYDSATGVFSVTTFKTADARAAISVTDAGGDGSLSYNNTTGVITYTGPSAVEVRAHFSAGGDLSYDSATGVFSVTTYKDADARAAISASGDLSYDSATGVFSVTTYKDADARAAISVSDNGGDGSLTYDNATGVITYTGPSAAEVRAHFSASGDLSYNNATGVFSVTTFKTADARQSIAVNDAGGDGSLTYNSTTGIIEYTGPSAAEVRAHFSAGGDLSYVQILPQELLIITQLAKLGLTTP